jgi:hypothetical protein
MHAHHRRSVFSISGFPQFALRALADRLFARSPDGKLIGRRPRASLAAAAKPLGLGLVVACALAGSSAQAFVGSFDGGGRVGVYLDLVAAANASGERLEIAGVCASACTMKLGARRACVYGDSQLWFHAARNEDGRVNPLATLIMLQQYPRGVRAWATARGALASVALTRMSGVEAIALGIPDCERADSLRTTTGAAVKACFGASDWRAVATPATRICARRSPDASASANASFGR